MITHREIVHKIVQRNKGDLSFVEVNNVLLKLFVIIKRLVLKGEEILFWGLFVVKKGDTTNFIKKQLEQDRIIRHRINVKYAVRKYRSWTKESADDFCSKLVDEINLHNQTK